MKPYIYLRASPFISGYLIALGICKETLHYSFFDVKILPYLQIDEAALLSFDDVTCWTFVIWISILLSNIFRTKGLILPFNYVAPIVGVVILYILVKKFKTWVPTLAFIVLSVFFLNYNRKLFAVFKKSIRLVPKLSISTSFFSDFHYGICVFSSQSGCKKCTCRL